MEIDHLIYAAPDLETGVRTIESLLGVRLALGGKHVGIGTHNALLSLGDGAYLEVIAPDPDQQTRQRPLPYGLDTLAAPHLVTWAVKATSIDAQARQALDRGVDLGPVMQMARERPDGSRLAWRLTRSPALVGDGLVPFLIAWEPGAHPSETSPGGCRLVSLRGEHPEPERIRPMVEALGAALSATRGVATALVATVAGPNGAVELR